MGDREKKIWRGLGKKGMVVRFPRWSIVGYGIEMWE